MRITSVTFPASLLELNGFTGTPITSLTIPTTATSIGNYAFQNCTQIPSIVIPANITSIGMAAFAGGSNTYTSVTFGAVGSGLVIGLWAFNDNSTCSLFDFRDAVGVPSFNAASGATAQNSLGCLDRVSDGKIVVPDALYNDWIADSRWSGRASQIIKASDYANL